jgi:hypothetical protein
MVTNLPMTVAADSPVGDVLHARSVLQGRDMACANLARFLHERGCKTPGPDFQQRQLYSPRRMDDGPVLHIRVSSHPNGIQVSSEDGAIPNAHLQHPCSLSSWLAELLGAYANIQCLPVCELQGIQIQHMKTNQRQV